MPGSNKSVLATVLSPVQCLDILPAWQSSITMSVGSTLKEAIGFMSNCNIVAAPVLDEDGMVMGVVENLDILRFMFQCLKDPSETTLADMLSEPKRKLESVGAVMSSHCTAEEVAEHLCTGVRRVGLIDSSKVTVSGICSQIDVVKYLHHNRNMEGLQSFMEVPSHSVGWCTQFVHCLKYTEGYSVRNALEIIWEKKLGSVAICDDDGKLVGSISANALRTASIHLLESNAQHMPVKDFLEKFVATALTPQTAPVHHILDADDAQCWMVHNVVEQLALAPFGSRELYAVDDKGHPKGIITLTDVLSSCRRWRAQPALVPSLKLPGRLIVKVMGARNLVRGKFSACNAFFEARCLSLIESDGKHVSEVVLNSDDPDWNDESFVLHLNNQNLHDACVLTVKSARLLRADRFLGCTSIDLEWIATGFGTGAARTEFSEARALTMPGEASDGEFGEIDLQYVYVPDEPED